MSVPLPLKLAETMDLALLLPETGTVRGTGIVIWDDKHWNMRSEGAMQ